MAKRVKTNYDRGYVNAMDKIRVFIESSSKVMYVDTREYKNAETARCAYRNDRAGAGRRNRACYLQPQ